MGVFFVSADRDTLLDTLLDGIVFYSLSSLYMVLIDETDECTGGVVINSPYCQRLSKESNKLE